MSRRTAPPFAPYLPRGDEETQRFAEDLVAQLNRPHRNEHTIAVPCDDALQLGTPQWGIVPADAYGGQTAVRVAGAANCTALVGASIGTNSIKAVPFIVDHAFPVKALACQCTTLNATSKARVGIYDAIDSLRGDWTPHALLVSSGEFDCASTGVKRTSNLSTILVPGRVYFAAFLAYTAATTVNTIPVAGVTSMGESNDGAFSTHLSVAWTLGSTVGLPNSFPNGAIVQTGAPPAVYITHTRPSQQEATLVLSGYSPSLDGLVLRRVRLTKNLAIAKAATGYPSVRIRALVASSAGSSVVGTFDSASDGVPANRPRLISSIAGDIDRALPAGCVLQAEITQVGWPKVTVRDATVLFDVAVT